MATAYALVATKPRYTGGVLYDTREDALRSLAKARADGLPYDCVIDITYTPPWEPDTAVRPSEATAFAQANIE